MALASKRALVLGSNSFTGAHFVDHLLANTDLEITGVSRSPEYNSAFLPYAYRKPYPSRFHLHRLHVTRQLDELLELCDRLRPGLVVNFAAQGEVRESWTWPAQTLEINAMFVVRFTEALRQRDYLERYVAISTPTVYGDAGENVREDHAFNPGTPYAASKLAGDLHVQTLVRRYGFPAVFTRTANHYGIHQQLHRIIPRAIVSAKLGRRLTLHGRGQTRRAFIHARDVADGIWRAASQGRPGEVYHLAPEGEIVTMAEVVTRICDTLGVPFSEVATLSDENFGQDGFFSLDAGKARAELGWKPRVAFADGLSETIGWVSDNFDYIRTLPLDYVHQP